MGIHLEYLHTLTGVLKCLEFLSVLITLVVFRYGSPVISLRRSGIFFAWGIMVAALLCTPLLLACYLMGHMEIQNTIMEIGLNSIFFVFFLKAGCEAVQTWNNNLDGTSYQRYGMIMGGLCSFASLAYLVDSILAVWAYQDTGPISTEATSVVDTNATVWAYQDTGPISTEATSVVDTNATLILSLPSAEFNSTHYLVEGNSWNSSSIILEKLLQEDSRNTTIIS